jgi:hypothetical protein
MAKIEGEQRFSIFALLVRASCDILFLSLYFLFLPKFSWGNAHEIYYRSRYHLQQQRAGGSENYTYPPVFVLGRISMAAAPLPCI